MPTTEQVKTALRERMSQNGFYQEIWLVVLYATWSILSGVAVSYKNTETDTRPNEAVLVAMGLAPFVLANSAKVKDIQRYIQMVMSFVLMPIINTLITSRACLHGVDAPGTTELIIATIFFAVLFLVMLIVTMGLDKNQISKAESQNSVETANEQFSNMFTETLQIMIGVGVFIVFVASISCWAQTTPLGKVVSGAISLAFFLAISRYLTFLRAEKTGWNLGGLVIVDMASSITSMAVLVLLSRSTSTEMSMEIISNSAIAAFTLSLVASIVLLIDAYLPNEYLPVLPNWI